MDDSTKTDSPSPTSSLRSSLNLMSPANLERVAALLKEQLSQVPWYAEQERKCGPGMWRAMAASQPRIGLLDPSPKSSTPR